MQKQFSVKTEEGVLSAFDEIHLELQSLTKGDTFSELIQNYRKTKETLIKSNELTDRLTEENRELTETNQKLSEDFQKLSEENQRKTEEIQSLENTTAELSVKDLEIQRLTEENQKLTAENRRLTESQPAGRSVHPKWVAIAQAYAELNGMASGDDVVWHVFASYTRNNLDHGLKRPKDSEIEEINAKFNN